MWQEILQNVKGLLIIPGMFVGVVFFCLIVGKIIRWASPIWPMVRAFWERVAEYIFYPLGRILRYIRTKIRQAILRIGRLLQPLVQICLTALFRGLKYLAIVAGSFLLWVIIWSLWCDTSIKPFLPYAIAAILIGLPIAIAGWIVYCQSEKKFTFKTFGLAIVIGFQVISPLLAFVPFMAID